MCATMPNLAERPLITTAVDGHQCLLGGVGSLVLACPKCGDESYRDAEDWKAMRPVESCAGCGPLHIKRPIRIDDLDRKWLPLWASNGWL